MGAGSFVSVFELFKIGIGPSSSHTVGPMRAARLFAERLREDRVLCDVRQVQVELFGSLGHTGKGHGTDVAVLLGLEGEEPGTTDVDRAPMRAKEIAASGRLRLAGTQEIELRPDEHIVFHRLERLPLHSNGMRFHALGQEGALVVSRIFYSVGGGFVANAEGGRWASARAPPAARCRIPSTTAPSSSCAVAGAGSPSPR